MSVCTASAQHGQMVSFFVCVLKPEMKWHICERESALSLVFSTQSDNFFSDRSIVAEYGKEDCTRHKFLCTSMRLSCLVYGSSSYSIREIRVYLVPRAMRTFVHTDSREVGTSTTFSQSM